MTLIENIKGIQRNTKELLETALKCFKSVKDLIERATQSINENQSIFGEKNTSSTSTSTSTGMTLLEREKLQLQIHSNILKVLV